MTYVISSDIHGSTALMFVAATGVCTMTQLLLEFKPDVNAKDNKGDTALAIAVHHQHAEVVALLFKSGASTSTSTL